MKYLLLFLATVSLAGETVTYKPVTYALLGPTGTPISKGYATLELCVASAPIPATDYRCTITHVFTKVGTCDDVPMPVVRVVVDAQGFLVLPELKVEALPDGTWGPTMEQGFVRGPGYPNCWVPGLVPYKGTWAAPEGPLSQDRGPWVEGLDYPIGEVCPIAAGGNCYPYPNKPKTPPTTCDSEHCVTG